MGISTNNDYYKELPYNLNDQYKQSVGKETDKMRKMDYITDIEHPTLKGGQTPLFYSLPKLHNFPLFFLHFDIFVVDLTQVQNNYQNGLIHS